MKLIFFTWHFLKNQSSEKNVMHRNHAHRHAESKAFFFLTKMCFWWCTAGIWMKFPSTTTETGGSNPTNFLAWRAAYCMYTASRFLHRKGSLEGTLTWFFRTQLSPPVCYALLAHQLQVNRSSWCNHMSQRSHMIAYALTWPTTELVVTRTAVHRELHIPN